MAVTKTTRSGWWRNIAVLTCGLITAGCGMTRQTELQQQITDRTPVDPSLYELSIDACGTNTEPRPGPPATVPVGGWYEILTTVTNRDTRIRQYEVRVSITSVGDPGLSRDIPVANTHRLAPGESQTVQHQGLIGFDAPDGITCEADIWPSLIEILDPPPDA